MYRVTFNLFYWYLMTVQNNSLHYDNSIGT